MVLVLNLLVTDDLFWFVCRYSDFVVHEINKEGKVVHLDDLSVPADSEVRYFNQGPLFFIIQRSLTWLGV